MRSVRGIIGASIFLLASPSWGFAPGETISVDEIHRGAIGRGLTVIEGTRIDEFRVEVIDVMRGSGRSGDIILARVTGLGMEKSGIAQGMSGSPVFVGGRLAGALAFAYPFAEEAIAGITPIGEMLELLERADEEEARSGGVPERTGSAAGDVGAPEPIATPLSLSGIAPDVARQIGDFFLPYGMVATAGGGGGGEGGVAWEAKPGAAVGVQLLGGDATIAAIGTVTWVGDEGGRILAFGHPMFQAGSVNMPLVSAEVHTLVPSTYVSFKLGSPIDVVGALVQDRRPGVVGMLGAEARTIPIDVAVIVAGGGGEKRRHDYHYDAMNDRRLTPFLVSWAVQNSILTREKAIGEGTVRIKLHISLEGVDDIVRENIFASSSVLGDVSAELLLPLQVMTNNGLARPEIRAVGVEIEAADGRRAARIEEIRVDKKRYRPGAEIHGSVTLRHYQGEVESRAFTLPLPADVDEGNLLLRVCDAASSEEWETKRSPHRFATKEIDRLADILRGLRTNDGVYVQLFAPAGGVVVNGREMPRLPGSVLAVVGGSLHDDDGSFVKGSAVASETIRVDAVVTGCKSLPVQVDRGAP